MATAGELVGLRLIIQPSPRRQQRPALAVLRRSSGRASLLQRRVPVSADGQGGEAGDRDPGQEAA
uniref:Uncharacterized protein n=1 Tax=Aegilops tauschii TaxID=37682 RepID=M8BPJ8_AEGTA